MKTKAALFALASLASIAVLSPPSSGAPAVQKAPPKVQRADPPPKIRAAAKLSVKNAAAVAGEKRNLEATLTYGTSDNGVAGKRIVFTIEGKNGTRTPSGQPIEAGSAVTNQAGKASVPFDVPELAQGAYALKAKFAGDEDTNIAYDEGNFGIVRGLTKIELKYEFVSNCCPQIRLKLIRTSDGKLLTKENLPATVNGEKKRWGYTESNGPYQDLILLGTSPGPWNVTASFAGDDVYQSTTSQATFTR